MTYLSVSLDYGKSFFEGSWNGYNAVSKFQKITHAISGQWIGGYLCARPPVQQLVEKVNNYASQPIQSLVDQYSVRRFRNVTELTIRSEIHVKLQENLQVAKREIADKMGIAKAKLAAEAAVFVQNSAESLAKRHPFFDLVMRIFNFIKTLPFFKNFVTSASKKIEDRCNEELQRQEKEIENALLACEDRLVAEAMSILDDQIFNKSSVLVRSMTASASKYAVELIVGSLIYQGSLQALACCVEKDSLLLSTINTASALSSFKITALATMGVGAAYLAPVITRRMNNKELKDQMKTLLTNELQSRLVPICKSEVLTQVIATNIADIATETLLS